MESEQILIPIVWHFFHPYKGNDRATEEEKRTGWWRGPPQPNPYDQEFENIEAIKANMLKQLELKRRSR